MITQAELHFDGATYEPALDHDRLSTQLERVKARMSNGDWYRLSTLAALCGGSEAAISARVRDLRKPRFGGYSILRRRVDGGLWEYRMQI